MDERLGRYNPECPWEIHPNGHVHELLSLQVFWRELDGYLNYVGVADTRTRDDPSWRQVERLYTEIVRDCPLVMTRNDYPFHYLKRLEITACEPSANIVEANPDHDYIGWNWKFTLNDGSTFAMPYTTGFGQG